MSDIKETESERFENTRIQAAASMGHIMSEARAQYYEAAALAARLESAIMQAAGFKQIEP